MQIHTSGTTFIGFQVTSQTYVGPCDKKRHLLEFFTDTAEGNEVATVEESIGSISGGFSGGGKTSSARKRYSCMVNSGHAGQHGFDHPNITFLPKDFEGVTPHEDYPIVVMLRIGGYDTERVLLNQGSSADVIYEDAVKKLKLDPDKLKPYSGSLVGFA